jgi:PhnB protein
MAEQGKAKGKVKPIPDGYHTLTPYISVKGAREALAFYKKAFGAQELFHMDMPDGRIGHAELQIGESRFMLADEMPERADAVSRSPVSLGGTTCGFMVYVPDVDAVFARAVEAGAAVKRPLTDQFYGDRSATIADPFGHIWTLGTHIEDVSPEEMKRRMEKLDSVG